MIKKFNTGREVYYVDPAGNIIRAIIHSCEGLCVDINLPDYAETLGDILPLRVHRHFLFADKRRAKKNAHKLVMGVTCGVK